MSMSLEALRLRREHAQAEVRRLSQALDEAMNQWQVADAELIHAERQSDRVRSVYGRRRGFHIVR